MPEGGWGLDDLVTLVRSVISGSEMQVDVVNRVDAGGATPIVSPITGVVAIAATYSPGFAFYLDSITYHFSTAPATLEDFTITLNAADGAAYDTVIGRIDPSTLANGDDLDWTPEGGPRLCEINDSIDVAFPNSDGNTYGLRICVRAA